MSTSRIHDDYLYYLIFGDGYIYQPWTHIWGSNDYFNDHWSLNTRSSPTTSDAGLVDMSNHDIHAINYVTTSTYDYVSNSLSYTPDGGSLDYRTADRLTLDHHDVGTGTPFKLALQGVEFVDAPVDLETHLEIITEDGFNTDGTIASLSMNVGHHEMSFTGAARDSTIFMGDGYDEIDFKDNLDVPGEQFWSVIRRADGELDVYSLFSGYRVQLVGGYKGWTDASSTLMNYGEVEKITLRNYEDGDDDVYLPGVDLPTGGDRGTVKNIDLRSDGELHSDSFNLAYFNFIRYTSDNVWVGEAVIHDGSSYNLDALDGGASDRTVTVEKYGVDAPNLNGTMSVIGQSRNGTHDLLVAEQTNGEALNGNLRLYAFDVDSGMYNEFNEVFLGTSADETVSKSGITGTDPLDRVAVYGFGGNDALTGGSGQDYVFGGQSDFDGSTNFGNSVTGGAGADYFGVGDLNTRNELQWLDNGNNRFDNVSTGLYQSRMTVGANNTAALDSSAVLVGAYIVNGTATDRVQDWDSGVDTLVVLQNGVAIIEGLYDSGSVDQDAEIIDLRSYKAVATSDQNFSGARPDDWDAVNPDEANYSGTIYGGISSGTLDYVHAHQHVRDLKAINNETDGAMTFSGSRVTNYSSTELYGTDVTVKNEGTIVVRGMGGSDTIHGSFGSDYIYGGAGHNIIEVAPDEGISDGVDKVFTDGFFGFQEVRNFEVQQNSETQDLYYLNADVLDFTRDGFGWGPLNSDTQYEAEFVDFTSATYIAPSDVSPNFGVVDFLMMPYKLLYQEILNSPDSSVGSNNAWSNDTHYVADVQASAALIGAGIATIYIGNPLVPFGIGVPMVIAGTSQIVAGALSRPHQNAQIQSEERGLINLLPNKVGLSSTLDSADQFALLDFFYGQGVSPNDGFARALEFDVELPGANIVDAFNPTQLVSARESDLASEVVGYYFLHTDKETFIYRVASSDRVITDDETYLVAEVEGLLTSDNLKAYIGSNDDYNKGVLPPDFGPQINTTSLVVSPTKSASGRTSDTTIGYEINLSESLEGGESLEIYVNGSLETTITDQVSTFSGVYDASSITEGEEFIQIRGITISQDGIRSGGETVGVILDQMAPEISGVFASSSNELTVLVRANDISSAEAGEMRVNTNGSITTTPLTDLNTSPTVTIGANTTNTFEVVDARDNSSTGITETNWTDGTKSTSNLTVYGLASGADGSNQNNLWEITGGETAQVLLGSGGDTHFLFDGNDFINGTAGDDTVVSGAGYKYVMLGNGNDTVVLPATLANSRYDGGDGVDLLNFNLVSSSITLNLGSGTLVNISDGNSGAVFASFENIIGTTASDVIAGSTSANYIDGGNGNDDISGVNGNNTIIGGLGADTITGGAGADTYVFASGDTNAATMDDLIGFVSGSDKLDFAGAAGTATNYAEHGSDVANFAAASTAADTALNGTIDYFFATDGTNGWLFYDADGDAVSGEAFDGVLSLVGIDETEITYTDIIA